MAAPQPQAQAPPPVPKVPVVTLRYQGGPPPPHPPVTEPTPQEEYQMATAQRQAAMQQKEMALEAEKGAAPPPETASSGGSALFKLTKLAKNVAHVVEKTATQVHQAGEEKVRAMVHQQNEDRYQGNFPEIVALGDTLVTDYSCKVMSQGAKVSGHLQLTNRHILFVSDTLKDVIPLTEVASVQRSIALDTVDNGPPFIMPIPAPHVVCDTLQIFTTKQQVFQFLSFESHVGRAGQALTSTVKGKPIDRCYNFLDHAWRAATPVPLPSVTYAQY